MAKFQIITEWSGYSRGTAIYLVEAKNEDEARENWCEGEEIAREVIRDDTETEIESVKKII